jgi:hypothetical protein
MVASRSSFHQSSISRLEAISVEDLFVATHDDVGELVAGVRRKLEQKEFIDDNEVPGFERSAILFGQGGHPRIRHREFENSEFKIHWLSEEAVFSPDGKMT